MMENNQKKRTPPILYKYCDWNKPYYKDVLRKRQVFYSKPGNFNDLFDCGYPPAKLVMFSYDKKSVARIQELYPRINKLFAFLLISVLKMLPKNAVNKFTGIAWSKLIERSGVLCLCSCRDKGLMWRRYAANHKGICVGFDSWALTEYLSSDKQLGAFITPPLPVKYSELPPEVVLDFRGEGLDISELLLSKLIDWQYECEWRSIFHNGANSRIELPHYVFKEIICGSKMTEEDIEEVKTIVRVSCPKTSVLKLREEPNGYDFGPVG